jgi:hypothetical protein
MEFSRIPVKRGKDFAHHRLKSLTNKRVEHKHYRDIILKVPLQCVGGNDFDFPCSEARACALYVSSRQLSEILIIFNARQSHWLSR